VESDGCKKIVSAVTRRLYADFCNKIGTKRKWRVVRSESAFGGRAEVGFRGRQVGFWPILLQKSVEGFREQ
jgi:hypothetical protein